MEKKLYNKDKLPKYIIVKNEIEKGISDKKFDSENAIPSEQKLMEHFNMSRITIRKAIQELVNEGKLYTIHGKGTFVVQSDNNLDLVKLTSCTEDMKRLGYEVSRKVIFTDLHSANNYLSNLLEIRDSKVYSAERIFYADGVSLNLTTTNLRYDLFPGIEKYDLENNSLYNILTNEYSLKIIGAKRKIKAVTPNKKVKDLLELTDNIPILYFEGVTYGEKNSIEFPFEFYQSWYRTDRFGFYVNEYR